MAISKKSHDEIQKRSRKGHKESFQTISSGLVNLDRAMSGDDYPDGGLVKGGHLHIWGKEGIGKTNLLMYLAKLFQQSGDVYWDDTEGNFNVPWAKRIGMDVDATLWGETMIAGEDHLDNIIVHTLDNDVVACFMDSVDNLVPLKQIEALAGDVRASIAHLMARTINQINTYRRALQSKGECPPTYIWVSQVRAEQNRDAFRYQGGHILKHAWTQSIRIAQITYKDENFSDLTNEFKYKARYYVNKCVVERNRLATNGNTFELIFDIKNAKYDDLLMLIIEKERFIKAGSWYSFEDVKGQGITKFRNAIESRTDLIDKLRELV